MFRLLRYFSVASLLAFLIVTALLGYFYRHTAVEEMIAQEESKNVAVTHAFVNSLRPQLIAYFAASEGLTTEALRANPALPAFQNEVAAKIAGLPVAKIKIYNNNGITIFSTDLNQIGEDGRANDGFIVALDGGVVSELNHRDTFNSFDGVLEDQDVLSTYFPVSVEGPSGDIGGVFELYSNVTPLLLRINNAQRTIVIGVALILAILYAILFLVVRHADGIIRRQHAQQLQAEEESRQQQRTLAVLRERERLARDLHDSVAQVLGYLNTQAQAISLFWNQGQTREAHQLLLRLVEVVQQAQGDVREQIHSLQTGENYRLNFSAELEAYLEQFRRDSNIDVELVNLEKWEDTEIDQDVETQLLRIVQEALTNMRKHAQATHGTIVLDRRDDRRIVTIRDDGKGFAGQACANKSNRSDDGRWHFGLQMMHDRTEEMGGIFEVQSVPGQGTQVRVTVPTAPKSVAS